MAAQDILYIAYRKFHLYVAPLSASAVKFSGKDINAHYNIIVLHNSTN